MHHGQLLGSMNRAGAEHRSILDLVLAAAFLILSQHPLARVPLRMRRVNPRRLCSILATHLNVSLCSVRHREGPQGH